MNHINKEVIVVKLIEIERKFYIIKNKYIIKGDITEIILTNSSEIVLIDTEDLPKLEEIPYQIYLKKSLGYAAISIYNGVKSGKKQTDFKLLHRIILGLGKTVSGKNIIDHINHNKLDNRKCNLRMTNQNTNMRNRPSKNSNNKSGYRNVFWNTGIGKWTVSLCKNYKEIHIGDYDDVDLAGAVAEEARQKYYGEYAGKS